MHYATSTHTSLVANAMRKRERMAISVRDNFSPITQEPAVPMVRNEVGQPGFTFTIDGKIVRAYQGQTILRAAIDSGIHDITNLCNDEKLETTSACRMKLVHI